MVKLITERKTVGEDPNNSPGRQWLKWVAGAVVVAISHNVYTKLGHTQSKNYTMTATDVGCATAYVVMLTAASGDQVSAEVSVSCAHVLAALKVTVQLRCRPGSNGAWKDISVPGVFESPPSELADANYYVHASTPCLATGYEAVFVLTGIGKATGSPFTMPPMISDTPAVHVGECSTT